MKKILLASTMLVGTAGFAAADNANFTWSGSAYAGVAWAMGVDETVLPVADRFDINDDGDESDTDADFFTPEVTASFTAGMMTTTDGGLEAGASITIKAMGVSMEKDNTEDGFGSTTWYGTGDVPENTISAASVYLKGDFGKFEVVYDPDGAGAHATIANAYDVNFKYSNTWGDFGVSAYYTVAPTDGTGAVGATNGDMGIKLSYSAGGYMVYVEPIWDESDGATGDYEVGFGGSATMSGFTAAVDFDYENVSSTWEWIVSAGYETGPYSIGAFVQDDAGLTTDFDYGVNAAYDLGGGVALEGQYVYDADSTGSIFAVGVSMKF